MMTCTFLLFGLCGLDAVVSQYVIGSGLPQSSMDLRAGLFGWLPLCQALLSTYADRL
jgi:hypothetical protein